MTAILDYPLALVFPITFVVLAVATWLGGWIASRRRAVVEGMREDFTLVQSSTLTLLALIIGFTFSMALTRYDQRKAFEEEEANAIGTAYLRADLLPPAHAAKLKASLKQYAGVRVRHYVTRDATELATLDRAIVALHDDMWRSARDGARDTPDALRALVVASVNDVINAQGYAQAAGWNRIPHGAWALMTLLAVCASFLVGLGTRRPVLEARIMAVLPLVVALAFFLIADIDAPRSGAIRVTPLDLLALDASLR